VAAAAASSAACRAHASSQQATSGRGAVTVGHLRRRRRGWRGDPRRRGAPAGGPSAERLSAEAAADADAIVATDETPGSAPAPPPSAPTSPRDGHRQQPANARLQWMLAAATSKH